ncbi:phosphoesterase [Winogradskyella sp. J14-2]|uniref:ligase-associated DNA damage response endonuclease PdeM n=1 Tax=Winogradskyella sp. J14-2 TaxID=1936080 RepID=UPI0009729CAD|nr:ligase-associated DNA damage response endonuclease PdeM [Winogradskyella sp. J14-2]APY07310.1 phosphoesterase [Winogradskyella sp. J14-2]
MTIAIQNIEIKNVDLILTNQRAIFWKAQGALILSDIHIGKTAHFRKHGIAVPDDILHNDLNRLKQLIQHFNAKKIIVVGDLFHAERNTDVEIFKIWLRQFLDLEWILVQGNHDRQSGHLMEELNIKVTSSLTLDMFTFIHDNLGQNSVGFIISGHTHPGVLLKGKGRQRLKLPCYQVTPWELVLPAFSRFTGLNTKALPKGAVCYAFTDTSIFKF